MKIMVAYDGTLQSKEALTYGIGKAREKGGEVVALYVFNSPLFWDYDATPAAMDEARAESARFIDEARTIIREKGAGVRASLFSTDGNPDEVVVSFARHEKVDVLLCPPKYARIIAKYRKTLGESELAAEAAAMNVTAMSVTSRSM